MRPALKQQHLSVEQLMPPPSGSKPRPKQTIDYLLSAAAVCHLFGITTMTLWAWRRSKDFPTIRVQGLRRATVVFSARDVRGWAEKRGFGYLVVGLPR